MAKNPKDKDYNFDQMTRLTEIYRQSDVIMARDLSIPLPVIPPI
ncbi:hypothetical protein D1AOALGA4SA_5513 [Olavius algarvensis Delta 1 endosymbiont]|nr:hypothetical protein D1AOALGA4SA_5513 [Olavius algarvensis Delta 1 endosymbiont]